MQQSTVKAHNKHFIFDIIKLPLLFTPLLYFLVREENGWVDGWYATNNGTGINGVK